MKWRIAALILIGLSLLFAFPMEVGAATTAVVNVVMQPESSGGINNFTITYVTDTDMHLSWGLYGDAVNIMIRAKYGAYPNNIPDENTAPSDGYLVYYGNGVSIDDTSMNFNENPGGLYYAAWAQKADGKWYTDLSSGWKESQEMIFIGMILLAGVLTYFAFRAPNFWLLKLTAGAAWVGFMFYWINNPPPGVSSQVQVIITIVIMGFALMVLFSGGFQGYTKESNGVKTEGVRFQIPKFLRGENQDENGDEKPTASRREKMSAYLDRVNNATSGRREVRK